MQLNKGQDRAKQIIERLSPHCERIEVAGSIRRRKFEVRDIEIVAIPKTSLEDMRAIRETVNHVWGTPKKGPFPSKYTCVRGLLDIDFFWASKETFGLCYFIRTGCDNFVVRALRHWKRITEGGYSQGCQLYKPDGPGVVVVPTPEELDVFEALKVKFVAPEKRVPVGEQYDSQRQRSNPPKDEEFDFTKG